MPDLPSNTKDSIEENISKIAALFPSCVTEAAGESGAVRHAVDFDRLQQELSAILVTGPSERFHLDWPGKRRSLVTANAPIAKTFRPVFERSADFGTTRNIFISGDNLDAMKLLLAAYQGTIKLVYMDPPYNTGKTFVYDDNFTDDARSYLVASGQSDDGQSRLLSNPETHGRFHSRWLSMIYPRLRLAHKLLANEGVLYASIDFREAAALRLLLNEVFGESNLIFDVAVVNNRKGRNDRKGIATCHEHLLIYRKSAHFVPLGLPLTPKQRAAFSEVDEAGNCFQWRDLRKRGGADTRRERPNLFFPVYVDPRACTVRLRKDSKHTSRVVPKKGSVDGCWRWGKTKVTANVNTMRAVKVDNAQKWNIDYRVPLLTDSGERRKTPKSVWLSPSYSSDAGTKALKELFPGLDAKRFTPKSPRFIRAILQHSTRGGDAVLDLFAGTGTLPEAVMQLNAEERDSRHFIAIQLPVPLDQSVLDVVEGVTTLSALSQERMRRASEALKSTRKAGDSADLGWRSLTVDSRSIRDYAIRPDDVSQAMLFDTASNIAPGTSDEDLLFQIILDAGLPVQADIKEIKVAGVRCYSVSSDRLLVCVAASLPDHAPRKLALIKPAEVIFLDRCFETDAAKLNAYQAFATNSPGTTVRML